jgi:hypothetical protein
MNSKPLSWNKIVFNTTSLFNQLTIPDPRWGHTMISIPNKLVLFGGYIGRKNAILINK